MLHWIQYSRGYVTIKVWGYSTERFLNLCGNHNILVWDIESHVTYTTMNVSIKGFFEMKPLLKKTGTRAAILKKYGLPFYMNKMKKRKMFVAGLLGCFAFWIITSQFIWNIKIQGNFSITEDVLMDYLREQKVYVSMKQKDLHIEELEEALREHYDRITWASVQVDGTTLQIFIKENEMPVYENEDTAEEDTEKTENATDIIASHDGVISYIVTRSGVPQVMPGDTVKKGDILVSGAVPVYNEDTTVRKYQFCNSDADIMIRYSKSITVEQELIYQRKDYSGREMHNTILEAGGRELQCTLRRIPYELYDVCTDKKQVCLLDKLYLPLYFGKRHIREYCLTDSRHTEEEMQEIFREEWDKIILSFREKGVQIIEKNVTIKKNEKKWVLSARLLLEEPSVCFKRTEITQITADTEPEE